MTLSDISSRFPRLRKALKSLGTRVPTAVVFLVGAWFGPLTPHKNEISALLLTYLVLTLPLGLVKGYAIEQRAIRLIANVIDVLAICGLIGLMDSQRTWLLLLYVFPITAVSRYLRYPWGIFVGIFAAAGYRWATVHPFFSTSNLVISAAILITFVGVAINAGKLARSRDRFEKRFNDTIDDIYTQLLATRPLRDVMHSILGAALKLTRSDVTAVLLGEEAASAEFFSAKGDSPRNVDFADVERILRVHYNDVRQASNQYVSLVKYPWLASLFGKNAVAAPPWAGRLIAITIGGRSLGVLGVLVHRSVHYTADDVEKLKSLRALIALAQQNAMLSRELEARGAKRKSSLDLLVEIGRQLQRYEGSTKVYQDIVELVAQHVGSEEAALFVREERGSLLRKVAVAGPDPEITARLLELETTERPNSMTSTVYWKREMTLNNDISPSEPHSDVDSKELPSGITKHYMGAPLMIGSANEEPLGVIRVLNKRGPNYAQASGIARLDRLGFDAGDLALMTAIATYIAGAFRNVMYLEKSRHFQDLIYKSPDHIMVIDRKGYVQNFNRQCEHLWGIKEANAVGRHVTTFYESPEHAREIGRALDQAPDHVIHFHEAWIRDSTGQVIPVRLSAALLFDNDGKPVGSIGVFKDARELIRAENKRLSQEKLSALGAIAQTTGHDMKHDIGVILTYADMLRTSDLEPSERDEIHDELVATGRDLLNKVNNMLMTAKPRPPEVAVVSARSLMSDFHAAIATRAALLAIELAVTLPDDEFLVLVDPQQIRQVFANLFGNSSHAIAAASEQDRRQGRITFSATVLPKHVRILWCDNGGGMTEEAGTNVFSPFFTTKSAGTGLGLFINKTIIENHHGTIALHSTSTKGTCFEIILPLFHDPTEGPHAENAG